LPREGRYIRWISFVRKDVLPAKAGPTGMRHTPYMRTRGFSRERAGTSAEYLSSGITSSRLKPVLQACAIRHTPYIRRRGFSREGAGTSAGYLSSERMSSRLKPVLQACAMRHTFVEAFSRERAGTSAGYLSSGRMSSRLKPVLPLQRGVSGLPLSR
jgi:hypothetical protein